MSIPFALLVLAACAIVASSIALYQIGYKIHEQSMFARFQMLADEVAGEAAAKLWLEYIKAFQARIPWYQRSISTIGVIAFVGMALASTNQAVSNFRSDQQARAVEAKNIELGQRLQLAKETNLASTRALVQIGNSGQILTPGLRTLAGELLKFGSIDAPEKLGVDETLALLELAILLNRTDCAALLATRVEDKHLEEILRSDPYLQTSMSEAMYFLGELMWASELAANIELANSHDSGIWFRVHALRIATTGDSSEATAAEERAVQSIADARRIDLDATRNRLRSSLTRLRDARTTGLDDIQQSSCGFP